MIKSQMFQLRLVKSYSFIILMILTIAFSVFFGDVIALDYKVKLYTISHVIKSLLVFLMPLLILPFFINVILEIKKKSVFILPVILLLVWISNFTALLIPYALGTYLIPYFGILSNNTFDLTKDLITPVYNFALPTLLSIPQTMMLGLVVGLTASYFPCSGIIKFLGFYYNISCRFFTKIFIPILPVYVLGTMLKISYETNFILLLPVFGKMILSIVIIQALYILLLFNIVSGGIFYKSMFFIKNSLPAFVVGLSTMSSIITLPVTLKCAEKNTQNKEISRLTISSTVNCHDVGESISLPMIALTILFITYFKIPDFFSYLFFILPLSLAQFSGASVPGGSVAIMLPLLISCFGFSDAMSSLMIALSIIMDPIGTANNVMGNSAFVILVDRLYSRFSKKFIDD